MSTITERFKNAWSAFTSRDPTFNQNHSYYEGFAYRPDRRFFRRGNERSIVTAVYNRIAIDAASVGIRHVRVDQNANFVEEMPSKLNEAFSTEANIDQTGRAMIQDLVMSMLDEGVVALVPTYTSVNPIYSDSYDIYNLRVARITKWFPEHVRVNLYDDRTGKHREVTLPKKMVAIIENPLYAVMNEPNSTLQRLIRKLNILDVVDEQTGSGKLDLIIQLPYVIKTESRKVQAENRRKDIEMQLAGSKYGIAYTDGTERITQLNRPAENNLMKQIEYLTSMLYGQLGITEEVINGTADEKVMLNYHNRTIEPILSAITGESERKFLTVTGRTQGQAIKFFRDPFKLVPVNDLAEIADKFTRNEILSSNEIRGIIGYKPVDDPRADELRNKNLNREAGAEEAPMTGEVESEGESGYGDFYENL